MEIKFDAFQIFALIGCQSSASCPGCITSKNSAL